MGFRFSKPTPTSIHLKLEDSGKVAQDFIRDRNHERVFWLKLLFTLLVSFLAYLYIPRFVSNSYAQITDFIIMYGVTPCRQFYQTAESLVSPYLFQIYCYSSGEFSWDQCTEARYAYPYRFLQSCREYSLTASQCWNLLKTYPWEYTQQCLALYPAEKCFRLLRLMTTLT